MSLSPNPQPEPMPTQRCPRCMSAAAPTPLSKREKEVLLTWLLCETKTQAAKRLYIAAGTMNTHIGRIRNKYSQAGRPASTKAALLARALQDGIVFLDDI